MRIIFMGTPEFSVPVLTSLIDAGHEVAAVVTQPDKAKGRGNTVQFPPVKEKALEYGIPVLQPVRVRKPEEIEKVRAFAPDVIVVVAFGQILPQELLDIPRYGCLNVHASLLPMYRGAAPIQWAILNGEKQTGITIMQMDAGLDTGDMMAKVTVDIEPDETGDSLHDKLSLLGGPLLLDVLKQVEQGTAEHIPQEGETCYASQLKKEMGRIDFTRPAMELERKVRAFCSWPSAYTTLGGKTLKVWKASVWNERSSDQEESRPCGEVVRIRKGGIYVRTGEGLLVLKEVQLEGKKRMDTDAFLRGYPLTEGTVLGV